MKYNWKPFAINSSETHIIFIEDGGLFLGVTKGLDGWKIDHAPIKFDEIAYDDEWFTDKEHLNSSERIEEVLRHLSSLGREFERTEERILDVCDDVRSSYNHNQKSIYEWMENTYRSCLENPYLSLAIKESRSTQQIINRDEPLPKVAESPSKVIHISNKKTFEAAEKYKGKKVAVLNFANDSSIGGSPWYAKAQEEYLCRCSTLYRCLEQAEEEFYKRHREEYHNWTLDNYGSDDIIYTKDVIVFKKEEPYSEILPFNDWFKLDVITCAAPYLDKEYAQNMNQSMKDHFSEKMEKRIARILRVAKSHDVEVIILGAFGCGAFNNPPDLVAKAFKKELEKVSFEIVEFAIYDGRPPLNYAAFERAFKD